LISVSGTPEQPVKVGVSLVDISAGVYAAMSILASLLHRQQYGKGTWIDISLLETSIEWMGSPLYYYLGSGRQLARAGMRHNLIVPYGPYRCGEGENINLAIQNQPEWKRFCKIVLERPDLINDSRFVQNEDRLSNRAILEPIIEQIFSGFRRKELIQRLEKAQIAWGDVNDVAGLEKHVQLEARNRWCEILVNGKPFKMLNHPMNIDGMPTREKTVPGLGEHTDEILRMLGFDDARVRELRQASVV
jgi:crotonobetainyl-CoA:carnitine CoA-transferase CaiB-like acyl-CoA transferase